MTIIKEIKEEYENLLEQLSDPGLLNSERITRNEATGSISDLEKFEELSKRKNDLEKIIEKQKELGETENQIKENKAILGSKEDKELASLAEAEITQLQEKEKVLKKELENLLKSDNPSSVSHSRLGSKTTTPGAARLQTPGASATGGQAAIIEIRAGTGGQEAALFAGDLFQMYSKYAASQNWKQKTLDSHPTELGGFKEVIFELKNGNVFSKMKYEGGVHRVQRIPKTEKSERIHTSTATVAVLAKPKATEIKIKPNELRIDFYRASGPGGQYVNRRDTAVRLTHLPTGLAVASQTERNQLQNKENALSILAARLFEKKEKEKLSRIGGKRKAQIGWAKRAEKIRTYNFPQDRVTDHRIKKSWYNIENIMAGKLDKIIETLEKKL